MSSLGWRRRGITSVQLSAWPGPEKHQDGGLFNCEINLLWVLPSTAALVRISWSTANYNGRNRIKSFMYKKDIDVCVCCEAKYSEVATSSRPYLRLRLLQANFRPITHIIPNPFLAVPIIVSDQYTRPKDCLLVSTGQSWCQGPINGFQKA